MIIIIKANSKITTALKNNYNTQNTLNNKAINILSKYILDSPLTGIRIL